VVSPLNRFRSQVIDIPVSGSIPAGFADDRQQEAQGCICVDVHTLGIKPGKRTFALPHARRHLMPVKGGAAREAIVGIMSCTFPFAKTATRLIRSVRARGCIALVALIVLLHTSDYSFSEQPDPDFRALVFSKTTGFRHDSIPDGIAAIKKLGAEHRFSVFATEDSNYFIPENLARYGVVVFLNTSGDILNGEQKSAFENYIRGGGGLAGVHAAIPGDVATEGKWTWYTEIFCARFTNHSEIVRATIDIEDAAHPSTRNLPKRWSRTDEWYNFMENPRGKVRVLATLDESTYKGGTMGEDHPISWTKAAEKGRVWYTALGHTKESYSEPHFLQHLLGGIQAAAGVKPSEFTPNTRPMRRQE
jgi:type 1 glutamine amidotransferase